MKKSILILAVLYAMVSTMLFAQEGKYGVGTNGIFKGPVGLQLYSLREITKKDANKTLSITEDLGFKYVELDSNTIKAFSTDELLAHLKAHKLIAIGGHWSFSQFASNPEEVAQQAKVIGLKYAGCAWIDHQNPFDEKQCLRAAEVFNKAGKVLAKEGITFYYHNHGYEFQPYKNGTLFDLLVEKTDPKYVSFQMDVLWTVFPGQDPVALLKKYPNRWSLFHLKDLKKGVQGNLSGGTSVENDVALGSGQVDYPSLLKVAQEIGIKYYFIEDESPVVQKQLPKSLKYLESVKW